MTMTWTPRFTITPRISQGLMLIEAARALADHIAFSQEAKSELRRRARLRSAHFSTQIEGNRLTLEEARQAIEDPKLAIPGREDDIQQVRNYENALAKVQEWANMQLPLTETLICRIHRLVETGKSSRPTPLRKVQNAIKESSSGTLIYLPPEAKDLPDLVTDLEIWTDEATQNGVPAPIISGLVHYQLVTLHPFYDGNGRTARLLASFILHREGYDLNGFLSLDEQHAADRQSYYRALTTHPHHNYYEGRAEADLTPWLEYFVCALADAFTAAWLEPPGCAAQATSVEPEELQRLDRQARVVLRLFARKDKITASDVASVLGISQSTARIRLKVWMESGMLVAAEPSRRGRAYSLLETYRQSFGKSSAMLAKGRDDHDIEG